MTEKINQLSVSVIVPCRNEEKYIGQLLDNILEQDYPRPLMEVFVVDGQSTDKTPSIIKGYCDKHSFIHFLENPEKVVPHALNSAITKSSGEIIIRLDAHAIYPGHYISQLVEAITKYQCDNVGGIWETIPAIDTCQALAIALASAHPFGIGNAYYRIGVKQPREVDTVPFGCFRRELFNKLGLFDEELVRNQDDEFNARIINSGGKIMLLPDLIIRYFARDTLTKVSSMFYQYGFFKPLVNLKLGKPATWRQFAPPFFVLFLSVTFLFAMVNRISLWLFLPALSVYLVTNLVVSWVASMKQRKSKWCFGWLVISFVVIHFSYGWGYIRGFATFVIGRKKVRREAITPNR